MVYYTMKTFTITFTQSFNGEIETVDFRGFNAEHAEERFLDSLDEESGSQGVRILSVFKKS